MNPHDCCLAFINPLISPIYLGTKLRDYGFTLVAIYTFSNLNETEKKQRFHPEVFDHVIYVDNETESTLFSVAEQLKEFHVNYVFYGYEAGVLFTDQLAQILCPHYANDPATARRRFDKYEMQEALREAGMPSVTQLKITQRQLSPAQKKQLNTSRFPMMIKPIDSGGSVGVRKCDSIEEIETFLQEDHFLFSPSEVITDYTLQEYLVGDEYYVNTFSLAGRQRVITVNRYIKTIYDGSPVYRSIEVVDPSDPHWQTCVDYVLAVLKAVGLHNGFSHTELFLTADGPRLIEVNPRIAGGAGFDNKLSFVCLNYDQPTALRDEIEKRPLNQPKLEKYGRFFCAQAWRARQIGTLNETLLSGLPSYIESVQLKPSGTKTAGPPCSLLDTIAFILLANHDKAQLLKDEAEIVRLEKQEKLF